MENNKHYSQLSDQNRMMNYQPGSSSSESVNYIQRNISSVNYIAARNPNNYNFGYIQNNYNSGNNPSNYNSGYNSNNYNSGYNPNLSVNFNDSTCFIQNPVFNSYTSVNYNKEYNQNSSVNYNPEYNRNLVAVRQNCIGSNNSTPRLTTSQRNNNDRNHNTGPSTQIYNHNVSNKDDWLINKRVQSPEASFSVQSKTSCNDSASSSSFTWIDCVESYNMSTYNSIFTCPAIESVAKQSTSGKNSKCNEKARLPQIKNSSGTGCSQSKNSKSIKKRNNPVEEISQPKRWKKNTETTMSKNVEIKNVVVMEKSNKEKSPIMNNIKQCDYLPANQKGFKLQKKISFAIFRINELCSKAIKKRASMNSPQWKFLLQEVKIIDDWKETEKPPLFSLQDYMKSRELATAAEGGIEKRQKCDFLAATIQSHKQHSVINSSNNNSLIANSAADVQYKILDIFNLAEDISSESTSSEVAVNKKKGGMKHITTIDNPSKKAKTSSNSLTSPQHFNLSQDIPIRIEELNKNREIRNSSINSHQKYPPLCPELSDSFKITLPSQTSHVDDLLSNTTFTGVFEIPLISSNFSQSEEKNKAIIVSIEDEITKLIAEVSKNGSVNFLPSYLFTSKRKMIRRKIRQITIEKLTSIGLRKCEIYRNINAYDEKAEEIAQNDLERELFLSSCCDGSKTMKKQSDNVNKSGMQNGIVTKNTTTKGLTVSSAPKVESQEKKSNSIDIFQQKLPQSKKSIPELSKSDALKSQLGQKLQEDNKPTTITISREEEVRKLIAEEIKIGRLPWDLPAELMGLEITSIKMQKNEYISKLIELGLSNTEISKHIKESEMVYKEKHIKWHLTIAAYLSVVDGSTPVKNQADKVDNRQLKSHEYPISIENISEYEHHFVNCNIDTLRQKVQQSMENILNLSNEDKLKSAYLSQAIHYQKMFSNSSSKGVLEPPLISSDLSKSGEEGKLMATFLSREEEITKIIAEEVFKKPLTFSYNFYHAERNNRRKKRNLRKLLSRKRRRRLYGRNMSKTEVDSYRQAVRNHGIQKQREQERLHPIKTSSTSSRDSSTAINNQLDYLNNSNDQQDQIEAAVENTAGQTSNIECNYPEVSKEQFPVDCLVSSKVNTLSDYNTSEQDSHRGLTAETYNESIYGSVEKNEPSIEPLQNNPFNLDKQCRTLYNYILTSKCSSKDMGILKLKNSKLPSQLLNTISADGASSNTNSTNAENRFGKSSNNITINSLEVNQLSCLTMKNISQFNKPAISEIWGIGDESILLNYVTDRIISDFSTKIKNTDNTNVLKKNLTLKNIQTLLFVNPP